MEVDALFTSDAGHRDDARRSRGRDVVVLRGDSPRAAHDHATCRAIARTIAAIKGVTFAGEYDAHVHAGARLYFVPTDTLIGVDRAQALGIDGEDDLFGGVVPHAFVATKCISHSLVDDGARRPPGWSDAFGRRVRGDVLAGYSAFSIEDALRAGSTLLGRGRVRIKRALGIGGYGQTVVDDAERLGQALAEVDPGEVSRFGIALEEDLRDVTTFSVGQVRFDAIVASYFGTQRLARNVRGEDVYGGSDLVVARGDFDALLALAPATTMRHAIEQARRYDAAAFECFEGLVASRRNYDIAEGLDAAGERRLGVLEQSWRIGGASGAEVAALAAFREDPSLARVRATSTEAYGDAASAPPGSSILFDGTDDDGERLVKYVAVTRHVHP